MVDSSVIGGTLSIVPHSNNGLSQLVRRGAIIFDSAPADDISSFVGEGLVLGWKTDRVHRSAELHWPGKKVTLQIFEWYGQELASSQDWLTCLSNFSMAISFSMVSLS